MARGPLTSLKRSLRIAGYRAAHAVLPTGVRVRLARLLRTSGRQQRRTALKAERMREKQLRADVRLREKQRRSEIKGRQRQLLGEARSKRRVGGTPQSTPAGPSPNERADPPTLN